MKRNTVAKSLAIALTTGAMSLMSTPAFAAQNAYDTFNGTQASSSSPSDAIVGVGSDTTQIVMHDLSGGYNGSNSPKLSSFSAEGDSPIFLRQSSMSSIVRPNGSGAGKTLLYGGANNTEIDFARSSSTLSSSGTTAGESTNLQQAAFAVDGLKMAVSNNVVSNAPASISEADIVKIYEGSVTTWNQVGGTSGATIHPYIPQAGSGTRSFFLSKLKAANGGVDIALSSTKVKSTQEHSPTDIQNDPNAIVPFSTARAASLTSVKLLGGTKWERAVYNVVRNTDLAGSTGRSGLPALLQGAFGPTGYICSPAGRTIIEAAGFRPLDAAPVGKCGVFTASEVKGADLITHATTTTLVAPPAVVPSNGTGTVTLTATVDGGTTKAGKVRFTEGGMDVPNGLVDVNTSTGIATVNVSGLTPGVHHFKASFEPTSTANDEASASIVVDVNVVTTTTVYRFWSAPFNNAHFFTASQTEADNLKAGDPNWAYEGPAFKAVAIATSGQPCSTGLSPVFRFFSSKFQSHFFTSIAAEADGLKANDPNWNYEGPAYCAFLTDTPGTIPLYRFWSPVFGKHFFTANASEADHLRTSDPNWNYEGIAYYVVPSS